MLIKKESTITLSEKPITYNRKEFRFPGYHINILDVKKGYINIHNDKRNVYYIHGNLMLKGELTYNNKTINCSLGLSFTTKKQSIYIDNLTVGDLINFELDDYEFLILEPLRGGFLSETDRKNLKNRLMSIDMNDLLLRVSVEDVTNTFE